MILSAVLLSVGLHAQFVAALPRVPLPKPAASAPKASINTNHAASGVLKGGVLTLELNVVSSAWRPEGTNDPEVPAFAFAEAGKGPTVPGPMLRVPQGTTVRLILHSQIDSALTIGGLRPRVAAARDTFSLAAHATREITYTLNTPGTYFYWGALKGTSFADRLWLDSQLNGAVVVDAAGASTDDQVLLLSEWFHPYPDNRPFEVVSVINGKAWPYTERLTAPMGKRMRFRVINTIALTHPMHLHGAYYTVEARGDWDKDGPIAKPMQPLANTDLLPPGHTLTLSFTLDRPGNWLFHCHLSPHMDETVTLSGSPKDSAEAAAQASSHVMNGSGHAMMPGGEHTMHGLVVGIVVPTPAGYVEPVSVAPRAMRLLVQKSPNRLFGGAAAYGFVLQKGDSVPAKDSVDLPGPVLELVRGKAVRITVVNQLSEPTGVHWHGLEIPSFPDGVPDWSGRDGKLFKPIAPRDSFVAEFTPPRSGTFPYHSHLNERHQIQSGMYGAIIVSDKPRDPKFDHLIVAGGGGPALETKIESPFARVNGSLFPDPIRMTVGETHRLRLLSIHPDWRIKFTMLNDTTIARWRAVAKDGADLPPQQATMRAASLDMGPGETADFEFRPTAPGRWRLEMRTVDPGWYIPLDIIVSAAPKAAPPAASKTAAKDAAKQ